MTRNEFFSILGIGTTAVLLGKALESCSKNSASSNASSTDFTINLTSSSYSVLKDDGSYVYDNNIIIANVGGSNYVALSQICTHAGCKVSFDGSSTFPCPCHGSVFDLNGNVIHGPAVLPLKKYNTQLSGNSLRIYS
jgi:cytochrome b6-f complex iron-sulfur subunit